MELNEVEVGKDYRYVKTNDSLAFDMYFGGTAYVVAVDEVTEDGQVPPYPIMVNLMKNWERIQNVSVNPNELEEL